MDNQEPQAQTQQQPATATTTDTTGANDAAADVTTVVDDVKQDAADIQSAVQSPEVKAVESDAVKTFEDVKAALWAISATARKDIHDLLSKIENEEGVGMGVVRKHLGI